MEGRGELPRIELGRQLWAEPEGSGVEVKQPQSTTSCAVGTEKSKGPETRRYCGDHRMTMECVCECAHT